MTCPYIKTFVCRILNFQDLLSRILKSRFGKQTLENKIHSTCQILKCLRLYAESTTIFFCCCCCFLVFLCGSGGQECSLEQCCNKFETTWESCDAECKSVLLFVHSIFPFKIIAKVSVKTGTDFNHGQISLQSPLSLLKQSNDSHQTSLTLLKLFYSCFFFPVLS